MKNYLILASIFLFAGCSSPKYTYNFDYYDYNSGKSSANKTEEVKAPSQPDPTTLTASIENIPMVTEEAAAADAPRILTSAKKYSDLTKAEKKEFRKEVRAEIKNYAKALKKGDVVNANQQVNQMDNDLKLAIIFGAVGLTLSLFGGINEAFWILGVIAIVVGVVFLVKWLVRQ